MLPSIGDSCMTDASNYGKVGSQKSFSNILYVDASLVMTADIHTHRLLSNISILKNVSNPKILKTHVQSLVHNKNQLFFSFIQFQIQSNPQVPTIDNIISFFSKGLDISNNILAVSLDNKSSQFLFQEYSIAVVSVLFFCHFPSLESLLRIFGEICFT